jgi:GT2 family glycosyltransferase
MTELAIVILNYNTRQHLETFIPDLVGSIGDKPAKIWIADNASTDDSLVYIRNQFPEIETIALEKNFGFAAGYNQALTQIDAPFYFLLNSDVEANIGEVWQMVEYLKENPNVAGCQPKILSYNKKTHFEYAGAAGGMIDALGYPFCRGRIFEHAEEDLGQYDDLISIFWASGAAFMVRSSVFKKFGGFDPYYFAHVEEIDLCWRIQRGGYHWKVYPDVQVYHIGGGTLGYESPFKTYLNFRNSLVTILKNQPMYRALPVILVRLILDGLAALLFISKRRGKSVIAIFKAHWHFFFNLSPILKRRRWENQLIEKNQIKNPGKIEGIYRGSIVYQYYLKGLRQFSQLTDS